MTPDGDRVISDTYSGDEFVGNPYTDSDTAGTRAGALYPSEPVLIGIGAVNEHVLSTCFQNCDLVYPDITLGFTL